jgi:dienelactone hydrolase
MRERAINITGPVALAGVICEPQQPDREKPVFVILNSGVMHHVGACRLSVTLARAVSEDTGMVAVRFDFSGIGDSENRSGNSSLNEQAREEIHIILDYLQKQRGAQHFILCGLCSGAHNAMNAAIDDTRVVGLVQFDGHGYPTWKSYLHFYGPRLVKSKHWASTARRAMATLRGDSGQDSVAGDMIDTRFVEQPLFAAKPDKKIMQAGLRSLVDRQVSMLFAFTGDDHLDYMYQQQYVDCFSGVNFAGLLTLEHYPKATHIFTEPHYQRQLIERTLAWTKSLRE